MLKTTTWKMFLDNEIESEYLWDYMRFKLDIKQLKNKDNLIFGAYIYENWWLNYDTFGEYGSKEECDAYFDAVVKYYESRKNKKLLDKQAHKIVFDFLKSIEG